MERTAILTSSLQEMQAALELAADKLRSVLITDTAKVDAYCRVLDARLEVAGVIGQLRHYTAQEAV